LRAFVDFIKDIPSSDRRPPLPPVPPRRKSGR